MVLNPLFLLHIISQIGTTYNVQYRQALPSYEVIYVIPPMFEGLYLPCSSMDFQVMGLILKLIAWLLISQEFGKLSCSVIEKSDKHETLSDRFLFTGAISSLALTRSLFHLSF